MSTLIFLSVGLMAFLASLASAVTNDDHPVVSEKSALEVDGAAPCLVKYALPVCHQEHSFPPGCFDTCSPKNFELDVLTAYTVLVKGKRADVVALVHGCDSCGVHYVDKAVGGIAGLSLSGSWVSVETKYDWNGDYSLDNLTSRIYGTFLDSPTVGSDPWGPSGDSGVTFLRYTHEQFPYTWANQNNEPGVWYALAALSSTPSQQHPPASFVLVLSRVDGLKGPRLYDDYPDLSEQYWDQLQAEHVACSAKSTNASSLNYKSCHYGAQAQVGFYEDGALLRPDLVAVDGEFAVWANNADVTCHGKIVLRVSLLFNDCNDSTSPPKLTSNPQRIAVNGEGKLVSLRFSANHVLIVQTTESVGAYDLSFLVAKADLYPYFQDVDGKPIWVKPEIYGLLPDYLKLDSSVYEKANYTAKSNGPEQSLTFGYDGQRNILASLHVLPHQSLSIVNFWLSPCRFDDFEEYDGQDGEKENICGRNRKLLRSYGISWRLQTLCSGQSHQWMRSTLSSAPVASCTTFRVGVVCGGEGCCDQEVYGDIEKDESRCGSGKWVHENFLLKPEPTCQP